MFNRPLNAENAANLARINRKKADEYHELGLSASATYYAEKSAWFASFAAK
jgi:hypothetical protein